MSIVVVICSLLQCLFFKSCFQFDINRISVENAYLDEKEDACCALGELAGNAG